MFKPVEQRHDKVLIIGGGESLRDFDFSLLDSFDGVIITVNHVIKHLKKADYWITVDPCLEGKAQDNMTNRRDDCYYFACYPQIDDKNREWYEIVDGVHYLERIVPKGEEGVELGFSGLQEDKDKITTGDSVYSALGLAYHFEATKVILLGVDCYGYGHWYDTTDPYNKSWGDKFTEYVTNLPKIYSHSVNQFNLRGAKIVNGSPESRIDCFERMTPEQAIKYFN